MILLVTSCHISILYINSITHLGNHDIRLIIRCTPLWENLCSACMTMLNQTRLHSYRIQILETYCEPGHESWLCGFRPGLTQTAVQPQKMTRGLNFRLSKLRDCIIYVSKTKTLISCAVTTQLICAFVFAYVKQVFS